MTTSATQVKQAGGLGMTLGVLVIVLGMLALAAPLLGGFAVVYTVGFLILASGVAHTVLAFEAEDWKRGALTFLLGAMGVIAGVLMIAHPLFSLGFLTLVLAAWFVVDGIFVTILAFQIKPAQGWGWTLVSGLVGILLGVFIWSQWPLSGAWAVGVLVGIRLIFVGWTLIAGGLVARRVSEAIA